VSQTISELATTHETVSKLLEELKLEANKDYFQHGAENALLYELLLDEWRETLSACKVKTI